MTPSIRVKTVAEEVIRRYGEFNNGSSPYWCYGSRPLVREGNAVYATVPEADPSVKPLCNLRIHLFRRKDGGVWKCVQRADRANEREPRPLVRLPGGRLMISANPSTRLRATHADGRLAYHTSPCLLEINARRPSAAPRRMVPPWDRDYPFFEHSYRGIAADGNAGSLFLIHQVADGTTYSQAWTYRDPRGSWVRQGLLRFPLRGCYPNVAVRDREVHVMAISDEVEPNLDWRAAKEAATGQRWDYDFRQLFYTWTPDVMKQEFSPILTVASQDETAGHIRNCDIWIGPKGDAWLLYIERNIWQTCIRDRFFPGVPVRVALKIARIHQGQVVQRFTLMESVEARNRGRRAGPQNPWGFPALPMRQPVPDWALFHGAPGGRLDVLWHQTGKRKNETGNFIRPILPEPGGSACRLPLQFPLAPFFTSCERAGGKPSNIIDLYGCPAGQEGTIRYAQLRLER